MMIEYYSHEPLFLQYTDAEILSVIHDYMNSVEDNRFSYLQLCGYIMKTASNDNKLDQKPDTIYLNPSLSPYEYSRISRLIWQLVWNREICIDFYDNPYQGKKVGDTFFLICREGNDEKAK